MPRFNLVLDEQLSDSRSNEVAYRLKIENLGTTTLDIRRISPQIPEGALLVEVKDSSSEAEKSKHKVLCEQLTGLLAQHVFEASKIDREARLQIEKQYVADLMNVASSLWRAYFSLFTGSFLKPLREVREKIVAQKFVITSKADAEIALKEWFQDQSENSLYGRQFRAKYAQLCELDNLLSKGGATSALATVEPESFFATTYVLRFRRSVVNPAKFSFGVEAVFCESGSAKEFLGSVSTTVEISARPYVLSIIAMLSALLGVAVKFSVNQGSQLPVEVFFYDLLRMLVTGQGISAIVLALTLFNMFEYLELSEKIKMRVGWRSALVFGILSGLFTERVIAALKALVGA